MSSRGWLEKEAAIGDALVHARQRRRCLPAKTKLGIELLERRVQARQLIQPFPRLFEEPSYWHQLSAPEKAIRVIRGAALLHPDWIFCGPSAALIHGLEVSQPSPGVVHVATSPKAHTRSNPHVVRHALVDPPVDLIDGIHVVDLEACVLGCIRSLDLPHGLAVADSYLRREDLDPLDLVGLAEEIRYRRERCRALRTARYADPLSENGGESVARGVMIELGYRVPELQVEIADPTNPKGHFRVDFLWRGEDIPSPVIGELDGMDKYWDPSMLDGRTTVEAFSQERIRESRLTATGASVMRFGFADVLNRPQFGRLLDAFGIPRS